MNKLIVCVMGDHCVRTMKMCLDSVREAEDIVFCWGQDDSLTQDELSEEKQKGTKIIMQDFDQEDKQMNGKQRNFYLNYLKTNYPDDWALCLDADEVVEDLSKIKTFIQDAVPGLYSVKMRHFIGDLGHEDATQKVHYVLNRLFKISEADSYPLGEHPVLQPKKGSNVGATVSTTIWHLAYVPNMWEIKERYDNHMKKSEIHSPEFLKQWYYAHLFGQYPKSQINVTDIPSIILNEFGIDKDEFYFQNRGIELKHSLMTKQWNDYFRPETVLDLGCGRGPYLYYWNWFTPHCRGIELSNWAVKNAFVNSVEQGDITDESKYGDFDLITAIDVLEHLNDEQLSKTLTLMSKYGKKFLFSIPFEGDPNLYNDSTHKQYMTKEDWIKKIEEKGIKILETPNEWLFANQLLIGVKK